MAILTADGYVSVSGDFRSKVGRLSVDGADKYEFASSRCHIFYGISGMDVHVVAPAGLRVVMRQEGVGEINP